MHARRARYAGRPVRAHELCSGPGKLTQALGISLAQNGGDLAAGPARIAARPERWLEPEVIEATRVGITRAVDLRWRFCVAGEHHVSRPRPGPRAGMARGATG